MDTFRTELTPLSFLRRSADVFPDKRAVVHGDSRLTFGELAEAVEERARALRAAGIGPGDKVAYLMPNVPEMLIAQFAVPLLGAVLVSINTRLAAEEVRYILDHSQSRLLVVDAQLWPGLTPVAHELETVETIVEVLDSVAGAAPVREAPAGSRQTLGLDAFLAMGAGASGAGSEADPAGASGGEDAFSWTVEDENATISINYTSGTTGSPKGVMYSHRGAYLNALTEIVHSGFDRDSVYLWTLPMFHCSGWCTAWSLVAIGGTQVCLREVRGPVIWDLIDRHGVSHLNGAPTVLTTIFNSPEAHVLERPITATVAAAPPSPTMIAQLEEMKFRFVHVYGLTETYGPYTVCEWQDDWGGLGIEARARLLARQGVGMLTAEPARVVTVAGASDGEGESEAAGSSAGAGSAGGDDVVLVDVPADGVTIGEVVMRGNNVMKGYYRDEAATAKAFAGGWFHSGDLGVMHPDGYIELRDRAKDIVVSGGENISTIEVEQALSSHPAVLEAAVVGVPDDKWGERPKAFVVVRESATVTDEELFAHLKDRLAGYKKPREIEVVDVLPKTSTGKIQKFALREKEWGDKASRIQG